MLPKELVEQMKRGKVVLFLGAGASIGSKLPAGDKPPIGIELRDRIAKRFLASYEETDSLSWVADLAESNSDLVTLQQFVAEQYKGLIPAEFHNLLPSFSWRGIVTTNFDQLVENIYSQARAPVQRLVPFLRNTDRIDDLLRDTASVALIYDTSLPLILSKEQYIKYRQGRSRLFDMFKEWASENTIVYVGYSIQDSNLREILIDLEKEVPSRPVGYLVKPNAKQEEIKFWSNKNISVLSSTFEQFITMLDHEVPKPFRKLVALLDQSHPITTKFRVHISPSPSLIDALKNDYEYVFEGIPVEEGTPKHFYSGFGLKWYPITNNLDVPRSMCTKIIEDVVLRLEEDRPTSNELYVIKAEAGAGKSVLLRRIAWTAATDANVLCLYKVNRGNSNIEVLSEISRNTDERIFIFIDDAADNFLFISSLINYAKKKKLRITIITTERINEWNMRCSTELDDYLSGEYMLPYLSRSEIDQLVTLLESHDALGVGLSKLSHEQRIEEFHEKAGRQLLVALHEVSHGKPFEEILIDEYNNLIPAEAKRLYLSVCILYRLNIPVRAGLISRVHGIQFEFFKDQLLRPLEHVIKIEKLQWGDCAYICRHPEIAQIVFERVLTDVNERFNEYSKILKGLNPIYSTDNDSLRKLMNAHNINNLFPNYADAIALFDALGPLAELDAYYLQQRANYERIRPSGNLKKAQDLLLRAKDLSPKDTSIIHTLAEVKKSLADASSHRFEREKYRNEAFQLLNSIISMATTCEYAFGTILRLKIDTLRDLKESAEATDRDYGEAIREIEKIFEKVKQRYPGDSFIYTAESDYAAILDDDDRSFLALGKARGSNPRDPYIVLRYSKMLIMRGDNQKALECVEEALKSNRGDKQLNHRYADILRASGNVSIETLQYYYRRAFTEWDENYESQFWYARYAFQSNNADDFRRSKEVFKHLREAPMSFEKRFEIKDMDGGTSTPRNYHGVVLRVEATHGFVGINGSGKQVFFHKNDIREDTWNNLYTGVRMQFNIAFSLNGPIAKNMLVNH
jgi:tetratricopeptide (TPR) repeat protein/cold shock CspA family protein